MYPKSCLTKFFAGGALGNSNLTMFSMPKAFSCRTGKLRSVLCISGGVFRGSYNWNVGMLVPEVKATLLSLG